MDAKPGEDRLRAGIERFPCWTHMPKSGVNPGLGGPPGADSSLQSEGPHDRPRYVQELCLEILQAASFFIWTARKSVPRREGVHGDNLLPQRLIPRYPLLSNDSRVQPGGKPL